MTTLKDHALPRACHLDQRERSLNTNKKTDFQDNEQNLLCLPNNKVMYTGVTNNLERRIYQHKNKLIKGFTEKYNVNKLVYFEQTIDVDAAITREKEIKKWRREKKNRLVESMNKNREDLSEQW
jgi:putative endonuclease